MSSHILKKKSSNEQGNAHYANLKSSWLNIN